VDDTGMEHKLYLNINESFEAFTAVKFQIEVFWIVTLSSVVVGYQFFRKRRQYRHLKRWYPTTKLRGVIS